MNLSLIPLPYRVLGIVTVIAAVIIGANLWLSSVKATAYQNGVTACQQTAALALQKANDENRESEAALRQDLDDYARRFEVLQSQRQGREAVIVTRIEDRLARTQNCEIDPEVIALRNQLRAAQ